MSSESKERSQRGKELTAEALGQGMSRASFIRFGTLGAAAALGAPALLSAMGASPWAPQPMGFMPMTSWRGARGRTLMPSTLFAIFHEQRELLGMRTTFIRSATGNTLIFFLAGTAKLCRVCQTL